MKTLISTLIFLSIFISNGFTQNDNLLKDKKGRNVLPEKGDFAIGIGANPFFGYLGNMFNQAGNNQLHLSLLNNQLYGKYFLSSQNAIRIRFGLNQIAHQMDYHVRDDVNPAFFVTDNFKRSSSSLDMALGYEWRKGNGRLQLSYGADLNLKFSSLTEEYSYGNKYTPSNTHPTTFLFGASSNRPLEEGLNSGIGIGARLFTGIEYFLLSKFSIGGEMGIGYLKRVNGKSYHKIENWDWNTNAVRIDDIENKFSSSTTFTDIMNGQIFILFHF